jgi:hypothetical protein
MDAESVRARWTMRKKLLEGLPQARSGDSEGTPALAEIDKRERIRPNPAMMVPDKYKPRPEANDASLIPVEQRCQLSDLNDSRCRWPVGTVGEPAFFFCGGMPETGLPYCHLHSRIAFRRLGE